MGSVGGAENAVENSGQEAANTNPSVRDKLPITGPLLGRGHTSDTSSLLFPRSLGPFSFSSR